MHPGDSRLTLHFPLTKHTLHQGSSPQQTANEARANRLRIRPAEMGSGPQRLTRAPVPPAALDIPPPVDGVEGLEAA